MIMDAGLGSTRDDRHECDASDQDTGGKNGVGQNGTGQNGVGQNGAGQDGAGFDAEPRDGARLGVPDPRKLARDWITLWQSELSAMAADREIRESWQTVLALWAGTMSAMLRDPPSAARHDTTRGQSGSADAPRAAPVAAAPDARDAEIASLARHVAALERRLADLERGGGHVGDPGVDPKFRSGRKPRR